MIDLESFSYLDKPNTLPVAVPDARIQQRWDLILEVSNVQSVEIVSLLENNVVEDCVNVIHLCHKRKYFRLRFESELR